MAMDVAIVLYTSEQMRARCHHNLRHNDRDQSAGKTQRALAMELMLLCTVFIGGQSNDSKKAEAIVAGRCSQHNESK